MSSYKIVEYLSFQSFQSLIARRAGRSSSGRRPARAREGHRALSPDARAGHRTDGDAARGSRSGAEARDRDRQRFGLGAGGPRTRAACAPRAARAPGAAHAVHEGLARQRALQVQSPDGRAAQRDEARALVLRLLNMLYILVHVLYSARGSVALFLPFVCEWVVYCTIHCRPL